MSYSVIISKVSVYSYDGALRFLRFCSECMNPDPDRNLAIGRAESKLFSNKMTATSVNVPICSSCYKPKKRLARTVGVLLGLFLIFFGGLTTYLLFGIVDNTLGLVGFFVLFVSAIVHFNILYSNPVKMKKSPPRMVIQFKNPKYGELFRVANSDYTGQCEIIK